MLWRRDSKTSLISDTNKYSISRVQMAEQTVVELWLNCGKYWKMLHLERCGDGDNDRRNAILKLKQMAEDHRCGNITEPSR